MGLTGCHDWPDERVTAIEAQSILRDLSRIETIPDANVQGPAIYQSAPKKLKQIVGDMDPKAKKARRAAEAAEAEA